MTRSPSSSRPLLSVIIPVHNGASFLPRSLEALADSDLPRECWELIVVDDASNDQSASIASRYADTIVRLPAKPHGPAYARNRGYEVSRGEIVMFADADVCVHRDTLRRFAEAFVADPGVTAIFGSYDDTPEAPGVVSQYRNLVHHYVHQLGAGEADTFWAGCGAIRSSAFAEAGMYDEWHFGRPQIEDIELGHRVRARGHRIVLRSDIQVCHLKRWTLRGVITTDLRDRGVPWMRLLIQQGATVSTRSLNLRTIEKISTLLTGVALLSVLFAAVTLDPFWLVATLLALLPVLVVNRRLYGFFRRKRGAAFAAAAIPLHLLYYVVNIVAVGLGWVLHQTVGEPKPDPSMEAFAEVGAERWPPVPARATNSAWHVPSASR